MAQKSDPSGWFSVAKLDEDTNPPGFLHKQLLYRLPGCAWMWCRTAVPSTSKTPKTSDLPDLLEMSETHEVPPSASSCTSGWLWLETCWNTSVFEFFSSKFQGEMMSKIQFAYVFHMPMKFGKSNLALLAGGFNHFFHNIWDYPSHWLRFFKMIKTTNQTTVCSALSVLALPP